MNKYSLSYNQVKARGEATEIRSKNRIGLVGIIILFALYGEFDGNVRVLEDCDKDLVCRNFLYYFPSWIDDIVPPCTIDKARYIDAVYSEYEECFLDEIRGDVYLYLESKLDELMREAWAEYSNATPEPFAGYEVGQ